MIFPPASPFLFLSLNCVKNDNERKENERCKLIGSQNPKLWALLESLVDSGQAMTNQRQRFCTTLALMLLLNPPKQVSGRQKAVILMNCIHMIYDDSK
jgi:hypothetical protein